MRHQLGLRFGIFLFLACSIFGQDIPTGQPPFSASPIALQQAFSKLEAGAHPVTILLEEGRYEYDSAGMQTFRYRMIFKVMTKAAAENWAMIERTWAPWKEQRPSIAARVISKDGAVHELDPKTIADSPVRDGDDNVLTDRRMVRAPLPAMESDSIVEEEIISKQTVAPLASGTVESFYFGNSVPVQRTIVTIRVPQSLPFRFKVQLLPAIAVSDKTEAGIRQIGFDNGPMKPLEDAPPLLPADEPRSPHIVFSTAADWNSVAVSYSEVVEKQLKGFNASQYLPKLPEGASRDAKILAIVSFLNKDIRYTGIEFSEASLVPHKPAEVLARKYGDCKDKSTLAVALLRSAGIEAYLALLYSSARADVEPTLAGIDVFNHAIVYIPGKPDTWLDPTDPYLTLRNVSLLNQGRYALIARPQTTGLVRTPLLTAEENRISETREFQLSELGRAHVTETSEGYGIPDRTYRAIFGDKDQKALHETFKDYIEWTYGETRVQKITVGDASDLTKPLQLKVELEDAQRGTTARTEAVVAIRLSQLTGRLPDFFRNDPKEKSGQGEVKEASAPRTVDFEIREPHTNEWHYVIKAPAGFKVRGLPGDLNENLGPATLTAHFASDATDSVKGDFRFLMPKRRFSAAEGIAGA